MYRLGKRRRRSKKPLIIGGIAIFGLLVAAGIYLFVSSASKSTKITNGSAVVRYVSASSSQKSHFEEGNFAIDLPPAWKLVSHQVPPASQYNLYTFQGTTAAESSRLITIYQDLIPTDLAVNREVSVQPQGDGMSHGTVSDNCVNFASDSARNTPQAITQHVAQLRWDGVDFLCDLGNYNRNVTGTSAQGTVNKITLTGTQSGAHSFFIVYTDNNINPDYTVLYNLLDSFKVK